MISIIVTSYSLSRTDDIKDLLESLRRQDHKNFEVIFITENSIRLNQFVRELMLDKAIPGQVIHNYGFKGLSEARNLGIGAASSDILGFVDDDVILDPKWTSIAESTLKTNDSIIGITGPAYPHWVGEPINWLPMEFDWLIGCTRWFKSSKLVQVRNCWGMNMCFKRKAFEIAGLFSTRTGYQRGNMGEDVDFSLRAKKLTGDKMLYIPGLKVWSKVHSYRLSDRFIMERSSWMGHWRRSIKSTIKGTNQDNSEIEMYLIKSILQNLPHYTLDPRGLKTREYFQRLRVITLSLFFLIIGYCFGPLKMKAT